MQFGQHSLKKIVLIRDLQILFHCQQYIFVPGNIRCQFILKVLREQKSSLSCSTKLKILVARKNKIR